MRKHLPRADMFVGLNLPHNPGYVIREHLESGNNGHVFRAHSEATGHELACKIVPPKNLPRSDEDKELWLQEAKKSNQIRHPSVVPCIDVNVWNVPGVDEPYIAFLYEYVPGKSLRKYLKGQKDSITVTFIETFLQTMLGLLHELSGRDVEHGDLHAGNVVVADPSDLDIEPRATFRVIDFGVRDITELATRHRDSLGVAHMLRDMLQKVDYQAARLRDKYVFNVLRQEFLERYLIETNPLADRVSSSPKAMYERLQRIDSEYAERQMSEQMVGMLTPFDYPNCEQMGHSHLLLNSLYSQRFLGLREIEARNNLVLTGPRGCGKTTVFRALSLRHRLLVQDDSPTDVAYIGIYYRCDDLYFAFPRYAPPERTEAINVPMHFVVVTLLAALLEVVRDWSIRKFQEEFSKRERAVADKLWDLLEWPKPDDPTASRLDAITDRLRRERRRAAHKGRVAHDPKHKFGTYFGPEKLLEACECLRSECAYLRGLPIYYFIDDYSEPKITSRLQENLNRLFMHRSSACFFKLSTESPVSFSTQDMDGKAFVEAREYTLVNLGLRYIKDGGAGTLSFLEDLFERRFREVKGYPVENLEELIGADSRNENAIARRIRKRNPPRTYYGKETLAALCSGDIHYMIRLVERMVEESGGVDRLRVNENVPKVERKCQHDVIRAAAGEFLASVRMLPELGSRLADVVAAFGNVARSYLMYRTSKNEKGNPPHQASRIEPYASLSLTDEGTRVLNALLRYSIFLEDPRGKSRRGQVVSRLYLRRYLIPQFNLTFSQRDSVELENRDLELLLTKPNQFGEEKRARMQVEEGTGDLFGGHGDE